MDQHLSPIQRQFRHLIHTGHTVRRQTRRGGSPDFSIGVEGRDAKESEFRVQSKPVHQRQYRGDEVQLLDHKYDSSVVYSLGKRKRWEVVEQVRNSTDKCAVLDRVSSQELLLTQEYAMKGPSKPFHTSRCHTFVHYSTANHNQDTDGKRRRVLKKEKQIEENTDTRKVRKRKLMNAENLEKQRRQIQTDNLQQLDQHEDPRQRTVSLHVADPLPRTSALYFHRGNEHYKRSRQPNNIRHKMQEDIVDQLDVYYHKYELDWLEEEEENMEDMENMEETEECFWVAPSADIPSRYSKMSAVEEITPETTTAGKNKKKNKRRSNRPRFRRLGHMSNSVVEIPDEQAPFQLEIEETPEFTFQVPISDAEQVAPEYLSANFNNDYFEKNASQRTFVLDLSKELGSARKDELACCFLKVSQPSDAPMHLQASLFMHPSPNSDQWQLFLQQQLLHQSRHFLEWVDACKTFATFIMQENAVNERDHFVTSPFIRCLNVDGTAAFSGLLHCSAFYHLHPEWALGLNRVQVLNQQQEAPECQICFTECESSITLGCGHTFCRDCLRRYVFNRFRGNSFDTLQCPSYKCDGVVDCLTSLQMGLPMSLFATHLWNLCHQIATHQSSNASQQYQTKVLRCPKPHCRRLIQLENKCSHSAITVVCICEHRFCSKCRDSPHWPIRCVLRRRHNERMRQLGDFKLTEKDVDCHLEVEGKHCPTCNKFIEKNGGCNHMTCVCGTHFCWECGEPFNVGVYSCSNNHKKLVSTETHVFDFTGPQPSGVRSRLYCRAVFIKVSFGSRWRLLKKIQHQLFHVEENRIWIFRVVKSCCELMEAEENLIVLADATRCRRHRFLAEKDHYQKSRNLSTRLALQHCAVRASEQMHFVVNTVLNALVELNAPQTSRSRERIVTKVNEYLQYGADFLEKWNKITDLEEHSESQQTKVDTANAA